MSAKKRGCTRTVGSHVESRVHSDEVVLAVAFLRLALGAASCNDGKLGVCTVWVSCAGRSWLVLLLGW